jgi:hypothetical protein
MNAIDAEPFTTVERRTPTQAEARVGVRYGSGS